MGGGKLWSVSAALLAFSALSTFPFEPQPPLLVGVLTKIMLFGHLEFLIFFRAYAILIIVDAKFRTSQLNEIS